jgi:hypothetical protein
MSFVDVPFDSKYARQFLLSFTLMMRFQASAATLTMEADLKITSPLMDGIIKVQIISFIA